LPEDTTNPSPSDEDASQAIGSPRQLTALLADDVPELRRLLRHVLEWSGKFEIVGEAENGLEAVRLAEQHKPDLLLLDISMPVMDGMEALPRILGASPDTKVVVLSGFEADRLARSALDKGAAAYVEKGIPPAVLVSQLLEVFDEERSEATPKPSVASTGAGSPAPTRTVSDEASLMDVSAEEMMSLVAHEIRNPLAVIQGFGMELQNRWDSMKDEQRRDAVMRMTERARYLNTVVNNLMFMRKLESGQAWVDPRPEDAEGLIEALADELRDIARGHPIETHIEADLPKVRVDVARLRQVLTNLVVNAVKYSPAAAAILLRAAKHDRGVVVQVVDRGPGIPQEQRDSVFEKFKRLESGGPGIGLGLFISRALMASMGGELWVEDSAAGTILSCLLPEDV
jgi:signal transduction histidine kinase